ncbi:MAG TPA: hypothetical protein PKK00_10615 [Bacteroidales bacterium]|nr:hypothetical protein [Bacteroidales bacterium]HPS17776.1 hypothetical protein [Bacteroidales bacterium]
MLNEKGVTILLAGKTRYDEIDILSQQNIDAICCCNGNINDVINMYLMGELSALD